MKRCNYNYANCEAIPVYTEKYAARYYCVHHMNDYKFWCTIYGWQTEFVPINPKLMPML